LRENVFLPLGMTSTDLLRSEVVGPRVATGYVLRAHGPKAVTERQVLTAAAGSAYSTPTDIARYLQALLGGGANEHGSVLKPETLASMFEPQYRPDPRLAGVGLSFLRGDAAGHLTVEHQGTLPGFKSQIFLAPDDGVGVMAFSNGTIRGETWLPVETSRLLSELIGVPHTGVRSDVPQHPEIWGDLCGRYAVAVPLSDVRIKAFLGAGFEVFVRAGRLHFRFLSPLPPLYSGFPLHPGRRGRSLRLPDRVLWAWHGHHSHAGRVQPRSRNRGGVRPPRSAVGVRAEAAPADEPGAVGHRRAGPDRRRGRQQAPPDAPAPREVPAGRRSAARNSDHEAS
jgi:hypothetical protein